MKKFTLNVPVNGNLLKGDLALPENYRGLIIYSTVNDNKRASSRNYMIAEKFQKKRFATFLFDLLTPEESAENENRFNLELLSEKLTETTNWLTANYDPGRGIGYFGTGSGSAAALFAAQKLSPGISAIVSAGGHPDLALPILKSLETPTLFLVGGLDHGTLELNKLAYDEIAGKKEYQIIDGATHLFEEPGKSEEVAAASVKWFQKYIQ